VASDEMDGVVYFFIFVYFFFFLKTVFLCFFSWEGRRMMHGM